MSDLLDKREIETLASSFRISKILLTAVELDLFSELDGKLLTSKEIAQDLNTDESATSILLNALCAIGLLKKSKNKYYCTETASKYLSQKSTDYMPNLHHTANQWRKWSRLTEIIKHGRSVASFERNEIEREQFIAAMHYRARLQAEIIAYMIDIGKVKKMLDVGGGSGAFSYAFMKRNPELKSVILDLSEVIPLTKWYASEEQMSDRTEFIEGDYLSVDFGQNYDMIFISSIIHMNSYDQNNKLIKKSADVLSPDGFIVIRDWVMNDNLTEPPEAALFSVNMLVSTKEGRTYSESEIKEWLVNAGIRRTEKKETGFGPALYIGFK
ncbi:methyltransferase [Melioribacter sp. OK-6-Me]|uniref:methyltransferase n=1 Tax=unclassified Melioribacter TaxID=2627329 RepID=UPI003EDA957F